MLLDQVNQKNNVDWLVMKQYVRHDIYGWFRVSVTKNRGLNEKTE